MIEHMRRLRGSALSWWRRMRKATPRPSSVESVRQLAAFVRQVAARMERLGTPPQGKMEVSFPANVDALVADVSNTSGLTRGFVVNALIGGFYYALEAPGDPETHDLRLRQLNVARAIESSRESVRWSLYAIDVDDQLIDVVMSESLRAQIPHGAWSAAAILSFARRMEPAAGGVVAPFDLKGRGKRVPSGSPR